MRRYNIKNLDTLDRIIFLRRIELQEQEEKLKKNFGDLKDHLVSSVFDGDIMGKLFGWLFKKNKS